jgi:dTDP-4-dehydrorhamnose reductase
MKVLILGAGGQVGRALQASAPERAAIIAIDNDVLDLTDDAAIEPYIRSVAPDVIINASGYTAVDSAENERELAYAINATAPGAMAWAATEIGARFIHISTDFVFDGTAHLPYVPDAPTNAISVYGRSKAAGEAAVAEAGGNALTVRTAWVYSAGGANFVETMLKLMASRDQLNVVADQIGTPTHADSLARALWALAATDHTGIVHFTDAGVASWYDFAVAIHDLGRAAGFLDKDIAILPIPSSAYPTPAWRPAYSVLDKTETWGLLGYTADHWRHELATMIMKKRTTAHG